MADKKSTAVVIDFAKAKRSLQRKQPKKTRTARAVVGQAPGLTVAQSVRRDAVRLAARSAL